MENKGNNKIKLLVGAAIIVVLIVAIIIVALSNNTGKTVVDNQPGDQTDTVEQTGNGDNDGTQVTNIVQQVDKPELGITMELSGDYGDCVVIDLTDSDIESILPGAVGGFKIIKGINNTEYTLSTILVAKTDIVTDPQVRGAFPYIYEAGVYSVLATTTPINDGKVDTAIADRLNAGLLNQLMTMFFDETVFEDAVAATTEITPVESTNVEDSVDDEVTEGTEDNLENHEDEVIENTDDEIAENSEENTDTIE